MTYEKQKISLKSLKLKKIVDNLTLNAQKKGLIKPVEKAFENVSVTKEIHQGKKEYFCD